uniref:Uncharacterized protein n=1 Tax=Anguilla anguilla TaxID=7936 RepID=A0A0E9RNB1_ANGAN
MPLKVTVKQIFGTSIEYELQRRCPKCFNPAK